MPKITQQQAIVTALTKRGSVVLPSRTRKYVVMSRQATLKNGEPSPRDKFFIGKSGALRIGHSTTDSFPANNEFRMRLLEEGGYKP